MFGKHHLKREEEISFAIDNHFKIFLEYIKPPHSPHLGLMYNNNKLIDVTISFENSKKIKKTLRQKDCTGELLIALFQKLQLTKFVAEIHREMNLLANDDRAKHSSASL